MQTQEQILDYDTALGLMKKWDNDRVDSEMEEMVEEMIRKGLGVALKKHWQLFKDETEARKLMYRICLNYTHISKDLCEHFGCSGFLQFLLSELDLFNIESGDLFDLKNIFEIIYNCSKNQLNTKYFRGKDVMNTIHKFAVSEDPKINMVATMTFFYVSSDDENHMIRVDDRVINNIAEHLKKSMENSLHNSDGWSTEELVSGIQHFASNDKNSSSLVRADVVDSLTDLMINGSESEKKVSKEALWMLSFNEDFKKSLVQDEAGIEAFPIKEETSSQLEAVPGVVWNLKRYTEKKTRASDQPIKRNRIMISYKKENRPVVDKIYEELKSSGYDVWIDLHEMTEYMLETMTKAIEESDIVLVCMSQRYKDSPYCRMETSYAFQLGKKIIPLKLEHDYSPDGWLGIVVAGRLYIDFSICNAQGDSFQEKISELKEEIENIRRIRQ